MDEPGEIAPRQKKAFSLEQKVGFSLIILIGVVGAILGLANIPASISRPFQIQIASYTGPTFMTVDQKETAQQEQQKVTDTDGDGLTDYDELYIYKTSPYLADSDSDGLTDKQEVYGGTDPNCPQGKDCGTTLVQSSDAAATGSGTDPAAFLGAALNVDPSRFEGLQFNSIDDLKSFFSRLTTKEIRDMLASQGVPQSTLDAMSDADLEAMMQASVDSAASSGQLDQILQQTAGQATGTGTTTDTTGTSGTTSASDATNAAPSTTGTTQATP